jgi:hypothetical protein
VSKVPWVIEEVDPLVAGSTMTYTVKFKGASSVTSPGVAIYVDESDTDSASTLMPSGSHTASGNVATLKPLVVPSTDGGKDYLLNVSATVDGNTEVALIKIKILRPWTGT